MNSEFAKFLRRVIETAGFTKHEWATILNVEKETIDRWLIDGSFPGAESCRRIHRTLEEDSHAQAQALFVEFKALQGKQFHKITPIKAGNYPTLAYYMVRPIREAFLRTLDTLPAEKQEAVLFEAAELARSKR